MNLFVTADDLESNTGGGLVSRHEWHALGSFEKEFYSITGNDFKNTALPWGPDEVLLSRINADVFTKPRIAHFYSGTFSKSVKRLKELGVKVTYSVVAHDVDISRQEHIKVGFGFDYPHLNQPELFARYTEGYRLADVIVTPGKVPERTLRKQGIDNDICIIPHGCTVPKEDIEPLPKRFTVGYLGAIGPDKGLIYLLQAWKKLGWNDATLVLAGKDSTHPILREWIKQIGGGNVQLQGWVNQVKDFYNNISLYVQPSATEGFALEVLEAQAYGRPVICSENAGAVDCLPEGWSVLAMNVEALAHRIKMARESMDLMTNNMGEWLGWWKERVKKYSWEKVEQQYVGLWESL